MTIRAFICGCSGLSLTEEERAFIRAERPWGLILFARNIGDPAQIRALADDFRACVERSDAPVLIDQEGGRVRRLRPPLVADHPPASFYAGLWAKDRERALAATRLSGQVLGAELLDLGITVDCAPVLDLAYAGAHDIIGDRAYGAEPEQVAALGRALSDGLIDAGVLPVIKHIPGHGRALADSHEELPVVDTPRAELERTCFAPFRLCNDAPLAMTAHVVYSAIDPDRPATLSRTVIDEIIRGFMGYDGLLMSDDLSMHALSGSFEERTQRTFDAGCDLALHCNGDMAEMRAIAAVTPELSGKALVRAERALALIAGKKLTAGTAQARAQLEALWPAPAIS